MTVGFKSSVGMFLFKGWDAGRRPGGNSEFGYYFATLIFVATLSFLVEAIPYLRGKYLTPSEKPKKGYNEI